MRQLLSDDDDDIIFMSLHSGRGASETEPPRREQVKLEKEGDAGPLNKKKLARILVNALKETNFTLLKDGATDKTVKTEVPDQPGCSTETVRCVYMMSVLYLNNSCYTFVFMSTIL